MTFQYTLNDGVVGTLSAWPTAVSGPATVQIQVQTAPGAALTLGGRRPFRRHGSMVLRRRQ